MKRWIALCGALLLLLMPVWAGAKMPDPPSGTADTYVFDYADVITDADAQTMDEYADSLNGETEAMAICVTVDFLDGMNSRDYAYDLFNKWEVGDKKRNDGVLLLFSRGDKAIEIATGTGLESILSDATAGQLMDEYAMPYLLDGEYSTGLREVFEQICLTVAKGEGKTLSVAGTSSTAGNGTGNNGSAYNSGYRDSYYDNGYYDDGYDNGYYGNGGSGFNFIGIVVGVIVLLVVANLIFGGRIRNGGCGNGCSGGGCLPGCLLGSLFGNLFGGGNNRNNRWPPSSGPRPPSGGGFGGGGFGGGGRSGGGGFGGFGGGGRSGGGGFGGGGGRTGGGGAGRKF